MHPTWKSVLSAHGASFRDGESPHFSDPREEIRAAASGDVLVDLSSLALIRATGPDTVAFLQGQLSNDIRLVEATRTQLSSYNTPKGRMLAVFRIFRRGDDYFLQLPGELVDDVLKRLRMFVLRSKVVLDRADADLACFGLSGPKIAELAKPLIGEPPAQPDECVTIDHTTVLAVPGPAARLEVVAPIDEAAALWQALAPHCRPVSIAVWRWLDIEAGIPNVLPGTVEEFVPQMTNLEVIGGVNFKKGCYPGQEIVARMQYLGQLKQRMYHCVVDTADCPRPGDKLFTEEHGEQAAGTVVDAQPAPNGGCDLLAVIRLVDGTGTAVHFGSPHGPTLGFRPLPYPIPDQSPKSTR